MHQIDAPKTYLCWYKWEVNLFKWLMAKPHREKQAKLAAVFLIKTMCILIVLMLWVTSSGLQGLILLVFIVRRTSTTTK